MLTELSESATESTRRGRVGSQGLGTLQTRQMSQKDSRYVPQSTLKGGRFPSKSSGSLSTENVIQGYINSEILDH